MIFNIIFTILGFVLLIKGADFLVDGTSVIAKKFHIPEIVIGLTIVAIGTSMPELVVSVTSAIEGYSDIAIGNVIGSNLSNMFLILGICSIIRPLVFKKETKFIESPFTIFITILLSIMCINNKVITSFEGIILLILCVIYILYNIVITKRGDKLSKENVLLELKTKEKLEKSNFEIIFYIFLGIVGLKIGGDLVVDNAVIIAKDLGISEKIVSLTILAFSTSLPELITSIIATKKGETDMAIGNILGSQIFNILLIIGTAATLSPINYSVEYNKDIILLIIGAISLGAFPFIGKKNQMSRKNGIIFTLTYIVYMLSLVFIR